MKRLKKYLKVASLCFLIVFITACSLNTGSLKYTKDDEKNIARKVDEFVNAYNNTYTNQRISGNILIAKKGKIIVNKSYGMADYKNDVPLTNESVFRIGSITKSFTAIAIMQLYEKGLLDINDPIAKYIPDQYRGDEITIHHLLTHTSGIVRDTNLSSQLFNSKEKIVKNINERSLLLEPGSKLQYSNCGYNLLAYIVEKVSGQTFEEYLKDNVFEPLNMSNTGCDISKDEIPNLATGHMQLKALKGKLIKEKEIDMSICFGSGNIYSTAYDMYLFDRGLYTEKILSKETIEMMLSNQTSLETQFGFGWALGEFNDHKWIGHGGHITNGYTSDFKRFPEDDVVVIVLLNVDWQDANSVCEALSAIALGEEYNMPTKHEEIQINKDILNKYEGKYEVSKDNIITIKRVDNYLEVTPSGTETILIPYSETEFYVKGYEAIVNRFTIDEKGNVTGLVLEKIADKIEAKKID